MQSSNATTETVPQQRDTVSTTFALPIDLWKALRNSSTDRMVSQQQIVAEALRAHLGLTDTTKAA